MTVGNLFNGIGGFALAAHWMGWSNVMHCEIDPFCNKVMNHQFPNSFQHEDIRTTDFTIWRGKLDLVTGGFPCQPYSTAGKRKGKDDDRHLWPQMLRAIREIQPQWIVGENVRGLTNWNGGLVFDEVQADLEAEGYEVLPFLLPAASVNAPHRRDRIFFVAYRANAGVENMRRREDQVFEYRSASNSKSIGRDNGSTTNKRPTTGEKYTSGDAVEACVQQSYTNAVSKQLERRREKEGGKAATMESDGQYSRYHRADWQDFPTQPPVCGRNDGLSIGLADITFSKWRQESIKALGNSVVPQVVYQIFKAIEQWQLSQE